MQEIKDVPIEEIKAGEHEQRMDEADPGLVELAASIKRVGIINPLVVIDDGGSLHVIAGHRRLVAAHMAGCEFVPCIVRPSAKAKNAEVTFAENFFRKDLSPVELACALKDCLDRKIMTAKKLAAGFHRGVKWVHEMIAIADWPDDVLEAIHNEAITVSAASNLAAVTDKDYRIFLLRNATESGATARTTAAWLQAWSQAQPPEAAVKAEPVKPGAPQTPQVPQAPCLCCAQQFPVNMMSHVPVCGPCIQIIRQAGISAGAT